MAGITIGAEFDNFEELATEILKYQRESFCVLYIKSSKTVVAKNKEAKEKYPEKFKYSSITYACKHNGEPRLTGQGVRNRQRTCKLRCDMKIVATVNKSRTKLAITSASLNHTNHDVSEEVYARYPENRRLTESERKDVTKLLQLNVDTSKNAEAILHKVPPRIMRSVHLSPYREHVAQEILKHAVPNEDVACDLPLCRHTKNSSSKWVECERCNRWLHFTCAEIDHEPETFVCILCI